MPHSSGGGSHGGGSHSSSHSHGGSGGSSGPRISSRPYPGCHYYVYYHHGIARRYYGDAKVKQMTKKDCISTCVFLSIFILFALVIMLFFSKVTPEKVIEPSNNTIIIKDDMNVLGDTTSLYNKLEEFKDTTGVVPAIYTISNDTWQVDYSNLEDYAFHAYITSFNDEKHWLFVYSVSSTNPNNWYYEFMQGDYTDDIINDHSFESLNKEFHSNLMNGKSLNESIQTVFSNPEKFMEPYVEIDTLIIGAFLLIIPSIGMVLVIKNYFDSQGRDNSYEIKSDAKEVKCDYCGGTYFEGDVTRCPHCGASIIKYVYDHGENISNNNTY